MLHIVYERISSSFTDDILILFYSCMRSHNIQKYIFTENTSYYYLASFICLVLFSFLYLQTIQIKQYKLFCFLWRGVEFKDNNYLQMKCCKGVNHVSKLINDKYFNHVSKNLFHYNLKLARLYP